MKLVSKVSNYCKKNNLFYLNLIDTSMVGIPDCIIIKDDQLYWIELKDKGDRLRPVQQFVINKLKQLKQKVYTVHSIEELEGVLNG